MKAKLNTQIIKANTSLDNCHKLFEFKDAIKKLHALVYYFEQQSCSHIDLTVITTDPISIYYSPMFDAYFFADEVEIIPE